MSVFLLALKQRGQAVGGGEGDGFVCESGASHACCFHGLVPVCGLGAGDPCTKELVK